MNRFCSASILLVLFSVSCTVIFPLPVVGQKSIQNTNDIWQGDLVLSGNTNHTIIGETFHINGSITITENATLYLRDATLNFTQLQHSQFNITLRDPSGGQPRLQAYTSTVASGGKAMDILVHDNGTASFADSEANQIDLMAYDEALINVSRTDVRKVISEGAGVIVDVFGSTIGVEVAASEGAISLTETTTSLWIGSSDANISITELNPGFYEHWNYPINCSIIDGSYPDITLNRSTATSWTFRFSGSSNVTIDNSTLSIVFPVHRTKLVSSDSSIVGLNLRNWAEAELVNTTTSLNVQGESKAWIHWYLDVHVVDQIDQDIPTASVTAKFANDTQADTGQTDSSGWARLTLLEKMVNATGSYPEEPYTVKATYETHMNEDTVEMTGNKELTIALPFMIPELPLTVLAVTAISVIGVAVLLLKRRLPSSEEQLAR